MCRTVRQPRPPPSPSQPLLLAEGPVISSTPVTVHAWSSPPSSPLHYSPPPASIDSPHTPTRMLEEPTCSNEEKIGAEINTFEEKKVKQKNILSVEVQEILKDEKLVFCHCLYGFLERVEIKPKSINENKKK